MLVTTASDSVVASPVLISRMRLSSVALGLGAGASAAAFVLVIMFVSRPALRPSADHPDGAGTLQLLWFARRRHEALAPLGRVDEPRIEELRRTGIGLVASAIAGESSNHLLRRDSARSSTLRMSSARPPSAPRLSSVAETSDTGSIHTDVTDSVTDRSTVQMGERYSHELDDRRSSQMLERRASDIHMLDRSRPVSGLHDRRMGDVLDRREEEQAQAHAHYSDDPFRSAADEDNERFWRDEDGDPFRAEDEGGGMRGDYAYGML
ncbi:hypothetical protein BD626DRAFT_107266 [Schizophyllum amplum]|uniref:Uncharacterized protein n=1 Tax=Schizophyllum amplum TaxID=97359 RepID=A0A550CSU7_9AGAR|nr:hypothetical protein BD626DRAFT_107266 [Auriculariopsis ampla]